MRRLRALPQVPTDWLDEIEVLAGGALGAEALAPLVGRAESLLVRMAGIAVAQGEEEATAVRRGLSYWPDMADLEIPSLG